MASDIGHKRYSKDDKESMSIEKAYLAFIIAFPLNIQSNIKKSMEKLLPVSNDTSNLNKDNKDDEIKKTRKSVEENLAKIKFNSSKPNPYPCYENKCSECKTKEGYQCIDEHIFIDFGVIADFHQYDTINFRFLLDSFTITFPDAPNDSTLRQGVNGRCILSINLKNGLGVLMLNLNLQDVPPSDIIMLKQIFIKKSTKNLKWNVLFNKEKFNDPIEQYIYKIKKAFGPNNDVKTNIVSLLEIQQPINDISYIPANKFVENNIKQIYGLLEADEGWQYVPDAIEKDAIANHWSTRDFVDVIPIKNSIVMINGNSGKHYKKYIEDTKLLYKNYGQKGVIKYFESKAPYDCDIACLNHGVLFAAEKVLLEENNIKQFLSSHNKMPENIDELMEMSEDYDRFFDKIHSFYIPEINRMNNIIRKAFMINDDYRELVDKRDFLEKRLNLKYTEQVNNLMALLAILSLIIAIWSVIVAIIAVGGLQEIVKNFLIIFTVAFTVAIIILYIGFSHLLIKHQVKKSLKWLRPAENNARIENNR